MSINITFLRHGQTDSNKRGTFTGHMNPPLNEEGKKEVQQVAQLLKDDRFDAVVFGKTLRVMQTAQIVMEALESKPKIILQKEEITEINFGLWEGMTADEIEQKYPAEWKAYMNDWLGFVYPEGESTVAFAAKCNHFIKNIVLEYDNNNLLIIAHKGFVLACMVALTTGNLDDMFRIDIKNAQAITIRV